MFARTCQECGNIQEDIDPGKTPQPANYEAWWSRYTERKCKKCKSIALDYGSDSFEVDKDGKIVPTPGNDWYE